jgi:hypothetical protein
MLTEDLRKPIWQQVAWEESCRSPLKTGGVPRCRQARYYIYILVKFLPPMETLV